MTLKNSVTALLAISLTVNYACHGGKSAQRKTATTSGNISIEEKDAREDKIHSLYVDACTYMMQGETAKAIAGFKAVLAEDGSNHASMYNIAKMLYEGRTYDESIQYIKNAISLDRQNYWYRTLLRDIYLAQGDMNGMVQVQEQLVTIFGEKPEDAILLATFYVENNRIEDALRMLQLAEQKGDLSEIMLLRKVQLLAKIKRTQEIPAVTQRLIEQNPENTEYYRLQYNAFNEMKQPLDARKTLQQLLEVDVNNGFALLTLSDSYRAADKADSADIYLYRAFRDPSVDEELKTVYLRQAIADAPKNAANAQRVETLLMIFNEAHPNSYNGALLKAEMLTLQGNNAGALNAYRELLGQNGNNEPAWLMLLQDDYRQKDFKHLKEDSENAMEYFPNNENFLFYLGLSSLYVNALDEAIYAFEKIRKKGSQNAELLALTHLQLGKAYQKNGNTASATANWLQAEAAFARFVAEKPNVAGFHEGYGDVLYLLGKRDEALRQWQQAIEYGAKFTTQEKEKELS